MRSYYFICLPIFVFFLSCSSLKNYQEGQKIPREKLEADYTLLRNILEAKHPSLYWYTPKDSMDEYFSRYYHFIADSMTEQQFTWQVLAPLISKIRCGHTSLRMSKGLAKWNTNRKYPSFPLNLKIWNDTMAVSVNLNKKDSVFQRGTIIKSINGLNTREITEKMFDYLPADGNANTMNYVRISSNFPYYHRNIFGVSSEYSVTYIDSTGKTASTKVPLYKFEVPKKKQLKKESPVTKKRKLTRQQKLEGIRAIQIDSASDFAIMTLNSFQNGSLKPFFRRTFQELQDKEVKHLILDIRSNGGGRISASTKLTQYLTRQKFRVCDTLCANTQSLSPYTKYIKWKWLNSAGMLLISSKAADGKYHIKKLEKKYYHPLQKNHFDGEVYILINGPTFSASSLFCNALKGQPGITLVGEETGGGWYGNNGIFIPDITLPHTGIRVRLPLYRLVQFNHGAKDGKGIPPDLYVGTSYDALIKGYDKKMEVVKKMIIEKNKNLKP